MNGGNQPTDGNGNHKDNHDEANNNGDFHDFGEHDDHEHAFMDEDGPDMVSCVTNLNTFPVEFIWNSYLFIWIRAE